MQKNLSQIHLTWTLTLLTARRVLRRKSTWFILAIGLLPCLISGFWILRNVFPDSVRVSTKPYGLFNDIQSIYFLTFYNPLVAIFLGLGTINDEIESRNITFILVRPLRRQAIAVGRYLGHLFAAVALVSVSLTANYFANMLFQIEDFIPKVPNLFNGLFVISFSMAALLGVVAALGTYMKKFAIMGSILWMVLDTVFSLLPVDTLKALSIKYKILASYWETLPQLLPSATTIEPSSMLLNALIFLTVGAVTCGLISFRLMNEIVLSDNDG